MEVDEEQALKDVVSQVFHVILGDDPNELREDCDPEMVLMAPPLAGKENSHPPLPLGHLSLMSGAQDPRSEFPRGDRAMPRGRDGSVSSSSPESE